MGAIVTVLGGVVVIGVALAGRAGSLPRNHWVGIRLPSTMRSDEAWAAGHRAGWAFIAVAGALIVALGVLLVSDPADRASRWFVVGILASLVVGGIRAHVAARSVVPTTDTDVRG